MGDDVLVSRIGFSSTDVDFTMLSGEHCLLRTGANRYVVRAGAEGARALHQIITTVLPRLGRGTPLRDQLSDADLLLLTPYLRQLGAMGVLFFPGPAAAAAVRTDGDRCLYTFIARRTDDPDPAFLAVKTQHVDLYGPPHIVRAWADVLAEQGLRTRATDAWTGPDTPPVPPDTGLAVLVSVGDGARLRGANEHLSGQGVRWVPVLLDPATIRIGPWTAPGYSACLACLPRTTAEDTAEHPGTAPALALFTPDDAQARSHEPHDSGAGEHRAARSWLTLQPGALSWAGGLVTHLALRAFVPMGPDHPWGRVTTIDAVHLGQTAVRLWRDPYCTTCARRAAPTQAWVEV